MVLIARYSVSRPDPIRTEAWFDFAISYMHLSQYVLERRRKHTAIVLGSQLIGLAAIQRIPFFIGHAQYSESRREPRN
jgi:hypothetical protein